MSYIIPEGVIEKFHDKASQLKEMGALQAATAWEGAASFLRAAADAHAREKISLKKAADESGYSYSHMARIVRDGEIPNVGAKGRPCVRRMDIPRKAGAGIESPTLDASKDTLVGLVSLSDQIR